MEIFHSVKDYAFIASSACCKSLIISCAASRPTEKRIKSGATPASFNSFDGVYDLLGVIDKFWRLQHGLQ